MSLTFVLAGSQIKKFRSAIKSLASIGSELLVEGIPERLVLRSINSARSAFLAVTFSANFFESYSVFGGAGLVQAGVLLKHLLATFRTPRLSTISFELNIQDAALRVTLKCDNRLVKRYSLDVTDAEILQANLDGQDLPVSVVAEAAELNKLLNTFQSTLDEITIIAQPEQQPQDSTAAAVAAAQRAVRIQSFYDPAKGLSGQSLHTSLALDSHRVFKSYSYSGAYASDVTVNLKDLKALVGLCVEMGVDVCLRFDAPGVPLLAVPHVRGVQEMDYTAELILATLQESQLGDEEQWDDDTTAAAAAGNARAAMNGQASDGFNTHDQRQTTGAVTPDRPETIAPATTFAPGAADAGETPQGRMKPAAAADSTAGEWAALQQQQQQRGQAGNAGGLAGAGGAGSFAAARKSAAAAAAAAGAGAGGSGGGGRTRSGAGSGLSRLQRLEAEEEAGRIGRVAPYSRLDSSTAGGSAAPGLSGGMSSPGAAPALGGSNGLGSGLSWGQGNGAVPEAQGFSQQQHQTLQQSQFASRSLGEYARQQQQQHQQPQDQGTATGVEGMAVVDGTDSQMDPETLPRLKGNVRRVFQQRLQTSLQLQQQQLHPPQAFGSEQMLEQQPDEHHDAGRDDGVDDSDEELPQTPSAQLREDGAGFGFL